jgi:YD repeat-containing protein
MMNTPLAQRFLRGALLACLASCTSLSLGTSDPEPDPPPPSESRPVPDHLDGSTELMIRGLTHPCGSVLDLFDGQRKITFRYLYDPAGRPQRDIGLDATGALYEQVDYTWDNSGHLTSTRDQQQHTLRVSTTRYDTLGEAVEAQGTLDSDTTDAHPGPDTRTTTDYADFDALGHPARSTELDEDLDAQTSQTQMTMYRYDARGRSIGLETRDASGALHSSEQIAYDDDARTARWQFQETPPPGDGLTGDFRGSSIYDAAGRVLSTHVDNLDAGGAAVSTNDTVTTWDGDRERSEVTTLTIASDPSVRIPITRTFQYQCDGTPAALAPQRISTLPALPRLALPPRR